MVRANFVPGRQGIYLFMKMEKLPAYSLHINSKVSKTTQGHRLQTYERGEGGESNEVSEGRRNLKERVEKSNQKVAVKEGSKIEECRLSNEVASDVGII